MACGCKVGLEPCILLSKDLAKSLYVIKFGGSHDLFYQIKGRTKIIVKDLDADLKLCPELLNIIRIRVSADGSADSAGPYVNLIVKINSLVPTNPSSSATYAVRVSTDSTRYSEVVQNVGSEVALTSFLMKGGTQKIKLETVKLISQTSWNVVSDVTADVIIKYTEGKF